MDLKRRDQDEPSVGHQNNPMDWTSLESNSLNQVPILNLRWTKSAGRLQGLLGVRGVRFVLNQIEKNRWREFWAWTQAMPVEVEAEQVGRMWWILIQSTTTKSITKWRALT